MALGFLSLPVEIRSHVYDYLFPSWDNPRAFKLHPLPELDDFAEISGDESSEQEQLWKVDSEHRQGHGQSQGGTPRMDIPLGLYRSCRTIYKEIPSAFSLVTAGAIIPTIDPFQICLYPQLLEPLQDDEAHNGRLKRFRRCLVQSPRLRLEPEKEQEKKGLASLVSLSATYSGADLEQSDESLATLHSFVSWVIDEWLMPGEYLPKPFKTLEVETTNSMIWCLMKELPRIEVGECIHTLANVKFYRPDGAKPMEKEWKKIENNLNGYIKYQQIENENIWAPPLTEREYSPEEEEQKYYQEEEEHPATLHWGQRFAS
ncbi:hypothetical protein MMC10_007976 [Thelotrema lepadinum]|nr:hypothetical protein [Thelotrema lepadinum]